MGLDPRDGEALFFLVTNGIFASFGAVANYLYSVTAKNRPLSWTAFFINIVLGFFVGNVVGDFLPLDFVYRDGTLLIAGFVCYRLLDIIERAGPGILARKILGYVAEADKPIPLPPPPADPGVTLIERKDDDRSAAS